MQWRVAWDAGEWFVSKTDVDVEYAVIGTVFETEMEARQAVRDKQLEEVNAAHAALKSAKKKLLRAQRAFYAPLRVR